MKKKVKKPIDTTKVSGGANENVQNYPPLSTGFNGIPKDKKDC